MAPSNPLLTHTANLTLPAANIIQSACQAHASHLSIPMNIAIVDTSLQLLSFTRMPGAKLTSIDIAINKAFTAAGHRNPTHSYKEKVWPGGPMYGIDKSNAGRFMIIGGGLPVVVDGEVVGGVGCSTGTPEQDQEVAQAGLDALMEALGEGRVKAKL